jgi:hypothetical protein
MTAGRAGAGRPVAHLALDDEACRAAIAAELRDLGWIAHEHPTGAHLLASISGVILGEGGERCPDLLVVDERARGCTGTSLAGGLRALGFLIPTVLVTADGGAGGRTGGPVVAARSTAPRVVAGYARALSPPAPDRDQRSLSRCCISGVA